MRNLRLVIAYDGTDFHGWQRQPTLPTIQGLIEDTVRQTIGHPAAVHGSGRTDAGVHASGQVANFETECRIPCSSLKTALNRALPPSVRIRRVEEAPAGFHSRYSARAKTYRYRIYRGDVCPPFLWRYVHQVEGPMNVAAVSQAAAQLIGQHDFSSFAAADGAGEPVNGSKVREIYSSDVYWSPRLRLMTIELRGSGFLHHMVRNIAGTLVEIGTGRRPGNDLPRVLAARDRRMAGPTAPACGLCLVRVDY